MTLEDWVIREVLRRATAFYQEEGVIHELTRLEAALLPWHSVTMRAYWRLRIQVKVDPPDRRERRPNWNFFGDTRADAIRAAYRAYPMQSSGPCSAP